MSYVLIPNNQLKATKIEAKYGCWITDDAALFVNYNKEISMVGGILWVYGGA
jgi:hypothetical protein